VRAETSRQHGNRAKRAREKKKGPPQLRLLGVPARPPKNGNRHGGRREGAGRKPKNGVRAGVSHARRPAQTPQVPVHVTFRLVDGLPKLRNRRGYQLVQRAMLFANRLEEVRVCHMSIQQNHLHLILEADDERALSRAMKRFAVSFAKNLNRVLGRSGTVFADRYHTETLETPTQVRNAIAYVLGNWRKHGEDRDLGQDLPFPEDGPLPIRFPKSWLLRDGWKRHGLISPWHRPGQRRSASR